jgi:hypothetical protein
VTEEEFIQREMKIWGIDYIDDLFMKGYKPTYVETLQKWMWLLPTSSVRALANI